MNRASPTPSPLEALPLEVFETICAYLAADKDPVSKDDIAALAWTSKRLLLTTSPFQFHTIKIRLTDKSTKTIPDEVARWTEILAARRCASHVRRLAIVEDVEEGEDDDDQYWPPEAEERGYPDLLWTFGDELWPLDKDDEFWTAPEAISLPMWAEAPTAAEKARRRQVWAPVVELVAGLPGLADVDYQCRRQMPPALLTALNNRGSSRPVRLHMYGFTLHCQYQDESDTHDVDEDEYRLATSPCLSSIRLVIPDWMYKPLGADASTPRFYEDAAGKMVADLAPNLKSVSVSGRAIRGPRDLERTLWPGFFPSRPADNSTEPRGKGLLEKLALGQWVRADPESIRAWAARTDFAVLRSLHLRTLGVDIPSLNALTEIAESRGLRSLRALALRISPRLQWDGDWNSTGCLGDAQVARLLGALRPLRSLELKGTFLDRAFEAVLSRHGPSLRRLRLMPLREHDVQPKPFVLTRQLVEALVQSCPNVEDLELLVPRSGGSEEEARTYRALAELPVLDRLSLLLDCSDLGATTGAYANGAWEFPEQAILNSAININTSSRSLAEDIFEAICLRRAPRLIRLVPDGIGNLGGVDDGRDDNIILIGKTLSRAWVRWRDDRVGYEGQGIITEVVPWGRVDLEGKVITGDYHDALEELWPGVERWPGGVGERGSVPLWKPS